MRISDELYAEMDEWVGALVHAFCEIAAPPDAECTDEERFLADWVDDVKRGMGLAN